MRVLGRREFKEKIRKSKRVGEIVRVQHGFFALFVSLAPGGKLGNNEIRLWIDKIWTMKSNHIFSRATEEIPQLKIDNVNKI